MTDLKALLTRYHPVCEEEISAKKKMLNFLENHKNAFSRELAIGHFTASAFLINSDKTKFLLMHHNKLDKWLHLGGHCDGDRDVLKVALKEAREESGIENLEPVSSEIFDLDIHWIPDYKNIPGHYHYDVIFLIKTVDCDDFVINHESKDLKWIDFKSYKTSGIVYEHAILRMIEKYNNCCTKF